MVLFFFFGKMHLGLNVWSSIFDGYICQMYIVINSDESHGPDNKDR